MMYIIIRAALLAACVATSGCAYTSQMQLRGDAIARQTADFDNAIAESDRRMIMTNVLRARDRESMSFSRLSILRGRLSRELSGSLSGQIQENGNNEFFTPNIGVRDEATPEFEVPVLNTQKFNRAIHAEIEDETYRLFLEQDWQPGLIHTLFISRIRLTCDTIREIARTIHPRPNSVESTELAEAQQHCSHSNAPPITLYNDPTEGASDTSERGNAYFHFHNWLRILLSDGNRPLWVCDRDVPRNVGPPIRARQAGDIQGLVASTNEDDLEWDDTNGVWQLQQTATKYSFKLGCQDEDPAITPSDDPEERSRETPRRTGRGANATGSGPRPTPLESEVTVRSPEGVLYYLGQVVRVDHLARESQRRNGDPQIGAPLHIPRVDAVRNGSHFTRELSTSEDTLFLLREIESKDGVSVRHHGYHYTAFYTPRGCAPDFPCNPAAPTNALYTGDDRTQQVIELVLQLFGMLQEREDLPISTAVSITR
jgi:hypothetical protein